MTVNPYSPSGSAAFHTVANPRFGGMVVIDPKTSAKVGFDETTFTAQDIFDYLSPEDPRKKATNVIEVTVDRYEPMKPVTDVYPREDAPGWVINRATGANGEFSVLPEKQTVPARMNASLIGALGGLQNMSHTMAPKEIGLRPRMIGRQMVFTTYPKLIDELEALRHPNGPTEMPSLEDRDLLAFVSNPYVVRLTDKNYGEDLVYLLRNLVAETDSQHKHKKRITNDDLQMFLSAISTNPEGLEKFLKVVNENTISNMLIGDFLEPLRTEVSRKPSRHYQPIGLTNFYQALGDPKSDGWEQLTAFLKQEFPKQSYDKNSMDSNRRFSPEAMERLKEALHIVNDHYQAPHGHTGLREHEERNKAFVEQYA